MTHVNAVNVSGSLARAFLSVQDNHSRVVDGDIPRKYQR